MSSAVVGCFVQWRCVAGIPQRRDSDYIGGGGKNTKANTPYPKENKWRIESPCPKFNEFLQKHLLACLPKVTDMAAHGSDQTASQTLVIGR